MPQTLQVVTTINLLIPPKYHRRPPERIERGGRGNTRKRNESCVFINSTKFNTRRRTSRHLLPCILQIKRDTLHCCSIMINSYESAVLMNDGPLQSKINKTFERFNCMVTILSLCEKIVVVCFWYDPLVVLNVIRHVDWNFRCSQTPWINKLFNKSGDDGFGNVHCYQVHAIMLAPSSSSEVVNNFEMCIVLLSITLSSSE